MQFGTRCMHIDVHMQGVSLALAAMSSENAALPIHHVHAGADGRSILGGLEQWGESQNPKSSANPGHMKNFTRVFSMTCLIQDTVLQIWIMAPQAQINAKGMRRQNLSKQNQKPSMRTSRHESRCFETPAGRQDSSSPKR